MEILLDIGLSSDSFYYLDGNNLGVEVGDIVIVKLRGRLLNGLVISKKNFSKINKNESNINRPKIPKNDNVAIYFKKFLSI